MMTIAPREKALAAATIVVLLFGALGLSAKGRLELWRARRAEYAARTVELGRQRLLIANAADWESRYAELKDLMPLFPADKQVDTYWMGTMDALASKNGLSISKRQVGAEKLAGDVYEFTIECREWEGSLEALVKFLYDLQAEGVMLDMRQLFVRPHPNNPGMLRGSFTLACAYLREKNDAKLP
jgi:hypothetical protein